MQPQIALSTCLLTLLTIPGATPARAVSTYRAEIGVYAVRLPIGWRGTAKTNEEIGEHVYLTPRRERSVHVTVLSKRSERPLTTREINNRFRATLEGYRRSFADVAVEQGPKVVPVGNVDSVGYLVLYNVVLKSGTKFPVRETFNYINRRMGPSSYLHHVIIGRCPLAMARTWNEELAWLIRSIRFDEPPRAPASDEDDGDTAPE